MSSVLYAANSAKDENGRKKLCSYTMYIYTVDLDQVAHNCTGTTNESSSKFELPREK